MRQWRTCRGRSKPKRFLICSITSGSSPRAPRYMGGRSLPGSPAPAAEDRSPCCTSPAPWPEILSIMALGVWPLQLAMACSTGPPGAICTMKKLRVMMAQRVGMISSRRLAMYAAIRVRVLRSASTPGELRFLGLVHPPGADPQRVLGAHLRAAELVPVGHAEAAEVPPRDDVVVPAQHPVQGPAPGQQSLFVVLVGLDAVDQVVHGRVLHPRRVVGVVQVVGSPDDFQVTAREEACPVAAGEQ